MNEEAGTPSKSLTTKGRGRVGKGFRAHAGAQDWWIKWADAKGIPRVNIPIVKPDMIRWMEFQLRYQGNPETYQKGVVPEEKDIAVWLAWERDQKSWAQIAGEVYPGEDFESARRKARHAHRRVWAYWIKGKKHKTGPQVRMERLMPSVVV